MEGQARLISLTLTPEYVAQGFSVAEMGNTVFVLRNGMVIAEFSKPSAERVEPMSSEIITTAEVAHYTRFYVTTIRRWARQGYIPGHKKQGRWLFINSEIDAWLNRHRRRAKNEE